MLSNSDGLAIHFSFVFRNSIVLFTTRIFSHNIPPFPSINHFNHPSEIYSCLQLLFGGVAARQPKRKTKNVVGSLYL
jgi:hypothetical protein